MFPRLYALGSNGSGQLALGHRDDVNKPTACLFYEGLPQGRHPRAIAAGGNHTLVLCKDGAVYASGENGDGRCGLSTAAFNHAVGKSSTDEKALSHCITQFHHVTFPESSIDPRTNHGFVESFSHVSATWSASFFATPTAIYSAGTGLKGELGVGPNVTCTTPGYPINISEFPPPNTEIVHLTSGVHHTLAILSNGEVYGWGTARHGELGEPRVPFVTTPRRIGEVDFRAYGAVAGLNWSYVFSAPVNERIGETGRFQHLCIGSDKHGLRNMLPKALTLSTYISITSSWSSIYVLLHSGIAVSWGRCSNDKDLSTTPPNLPQANILIAGSEHVLARGMHGGEIRAWGWGEHGNCGEGWEETSSAVRDARSKGDETKRNEGLVQKRQLWNILRVPDHACGSSTKAHVIPVGAGCATSWLLLTDSSI